MLQKWNLLEPLLAKPPAGTSLLFGALADSGQIKQRKNGSFRMVLKGVDEIDWFTDRPDRVEGTWKPQKLLRKWDKYFASSQPNAQATVEVGDQRELFTFEMFKPKMKSGKLVFNVKPLSVSSEDKIADLKGNDISNISLFIDDANTSRSSASWRDELVVGLISSVGSDYPRLKRRDLSYADLSFANMAGAKVN